MRKVNKLEIQKALKYYQDEIIAEDCYDSSYFLQESIEMDIENRAKEKLIENLDGFELLDINLSDQALERQEKEIINFINFY